MVHDHSGLTVRPLRPTDFVSLISRIGGVGWWNRQAGDVWAAVLGQPWSSGPCCPGGRSRAWIGYEGRAARVRCHGSACRCMPEVDSLLLGDGDAQEVSIPTRGTGDGGRGSGRSEVFRG
jgi:hypothetical protein